MRAGARLVVAADRARGTRITELRSDPPFVLRPTRMRWSQSPWTGSEGGPPLVVSLAAAAAGPLGGDDLRLDLDVGPGASVVVRAVSASVVLPGLHGERSRLAVRIRGAAGSTVAWLPGATVATQRCDHDASTVVALEDGARLLAREELVLGRHGERAGCLAQSLRVTVAGSALLHQDLRVGGHALGWDGPAVAGRSRAIGCVVLVDPERLRGGPHPGDGGLPPETAILDLDGSNAVVSAAAPDAHTLRSRLDAAVASLGDRSDARRPVLVGR